MTDDEKWIAVQSNDSNYDRRFYYAVKTTGIFCRPSCSSRVPNRDNTLFFSTPEEAIDAGFRPCKRCRPDLVSYEPAAQEAQRVKKLLDTFYRDPDELTQKFSTSGLSEHRLCELFKEQYHMTVSAYLQNRRLDAAKTALTDSDAPIIEIAWDTGFTSLSTFYRIFKRTTGTTPNRFRKDKGDKTYE